MRSLVAVSQRSLRRRKGRYALTALGIALGVAIVFAVLVTTAATNRAFDRFVDGFAGEADVVAFPAGAFDSGLSVDVVGGLRRAPDVELAMERYVFRSSQELRGEDVDFREFLDVHGVDFDRAEAVLTFDLAAGRIPAPGRLEVLITPVIDAEVGGEMTLATSSGRRTLRVVGELAERGAALANGGRTVYTTVEAARELQGEPGAVSQVDIVLDPDVDAGAWIDARRADLGEGVVLQESSELAGFFRQFLSSVQGALMITAAIALFVGAFMIFLTFSVTVAERTRFFGTLRALGAVPRQVRRLVLGEAVLLGVVSAAVGLVLGYALASASLGLIDSLLDLGPVSLEDPWSPAVVSVALGVGMAVVSAIAPARRAASLSAVAAMRDEGLDHRDRIRVAPRVAVLSVGLALSLVTESVLVHAAGALFIMLGAVLLVPSVLRPLARLLGRVTSRVGRGVGDIAVMHLVKERSRSAYTLALLMVVLAATIAIGASNLSMADTLDEVVERQFGADLQVGAPSSFGPEFESQLRDVPGIEALSEMRFGRSELADDEGPRETFVMVIDPETYFDVSSFAWVEGDDETAAAALTRGGGIVLDEPTAEGLGAGLGDEVALRTTEGLRRFEVGGTFTVLGFNGGVVVGWEDGERLLGAGEPMVFLVDVADDASPAAVRREIRDRLADDHDFEVETAADVKAFAESQLQGFFGIGYAVLLVSIVIGILGLANTLAVSVIQRTREIGILRSSGVLRRQLRAMVMAEAGTLVLVAWLLSLPLGWLLTRVTIQAFGASLGFTVAVLWPWGLIPLLFGVAIFAGAVASIGPARRAARLDPVVALRFD